jgi:hypothetical protein
MVRTDLLAATWDGFVRLTPGERRVFLDQLKAWGLKRRTRLVAERGGGVYAIRGVKTFADLTLTDADLGEERPATALEHLSLDW